MSEKNKYTSDIELSIVIPLYNEAESLAELTDKVHEAIGNEHTFELIFVDDGSSDNSWAVVKELNRSREKVSGIQLQRNYGKSTALQAGFEKADGHFIATMDADLQDDPFEIPEMLQQAKEQQLDLVSGWKKDRHDPISKTVPSRFFNKVTSLVTGIDLNDFNCGIKLYRREVVENIYLYGELHRYIPFLAKLEGYDRIGEKVVEHHPRKYGETKFGLSRFMHGFLDLLSLFFVNRYLQRPMHFFGTLGFLFLILGGGINLYLTIDKIFYGQPLGDRPLLLLGVMLMVLGAQIFSIGFLGELIQKRNEKQQKPNIKERV
ncbi:Glycosyltransferase involved in cell wall bisynthesis [Fodinibius salinus]|uniref:Glycosyltransferase involved in cell wall bisynthesis n=1 Tax=Fodinibius salinus TaxID=860790 RepID=A0A5D3YN94_9BACT|nr:glycosyltransferase family 2 protein [Fodinibius salinus]TYP95606.1 Glycosyltransferase involved in cell wall bisynthesis [Fodinibius salinus]